MLSVLPLNSRYRRSDAIFWMRSAYAGFEPFDGSSPIFLCLVAVATGHPRTSTNDAKVHAGHHFGRHLGFEKSYENFKLFGGSSPNVYGWLVCLEVNKRHLQVTLN